MTTFIHEHEDICKQISLKPYDIIDLEQGSAKWHAFREGKYGASVAPVIMRESPWQTPRGLFHERLLGTKTETNDAMRRGTELEPVARGIVNQNIKRTGFSYEPAVLQLKENPKIFASLDGFYEGVGGRPHVLEIKCPGFKDHDLALSGSIPTKYKGQLQHQMMVSGADRVLYFSYDPKREEGRQRATVFMERDDEYIQRLLKAILDFDDMWVNLVEPDLSEQDFR